MQQLTELTAHKIDMEKSTQGHNISTHIEIDLKKKTTTIIKVFVGHLLTHAHTMTNIRWYNNFLPFQRKLAVFNYDPVSANEILFKAFHVVLKTFIARGVNK